MIPLSKPQLARLKNLRGSGSPIETTHRIEIIKSHIATVYGLDPETLFGKTRVCHVIWPRHLSIWLCRHFTQAPTRAIGKQHGGRDHGTVLNAIRCVEDRVATEPARAKELEEWKTIIPGLLNP